MTESLTDLKKLVRRLLQETLDRREPVLARFPGILGLTNDVGSAEVSGKQGWVYVRIGNDETLATAFNNRTAKRNGLPVIVGYDAAQPDLFQVISTREVYEGASASGGSIPAHHQQHEFGNAEGGEDIIWMRMRQLTDLMVYPTNPESLLINIASGFYLIGTTVYNYAGGNLDLTSAVPGASRRWVLVACDENGPYTVEGAQGAYDYSDIPDATDPTHYKLAAVFLKAGDTEITDWPNEARFVDLRLAGSRSISGSGGFVDWENCAVVAKSGGNYSTIQAAITAVSSGDQVLILPGNWAENLDTTSVSLLVSGILDQQHSGNYGVLLTGADDTGPMITIDTYCIWGNMVLSRTLTGGAGAYYGIDASDGTTYCHLTGIRASILQGATGRDVYACRIASSVNPSTITGCKFITDNNSTGGATLEAGAGDLEVRRSVFQDTGGYIAVRITGTGTYTLDECTIDGDVVISGAATVQFRNCTISGDLTIAGTGATVQARDCYIGGDVSVGSGDTWVPHNVDQAVAKTVTGAGDIIPTWLSTDESTYTDHVFGPIATDQAVYLRLAPHGSYGSIVPAGYGAYWTEYLGEADYEAVEMLAFNDGVDEFGCLRTVAGGAGTLHDLRWGVGTDKTKYATIDSSGRVAIGHSSPTDMLHIQRDASGGVLMDSYRDSGATHTQIKCRAARGTAASPLALDSGDQALRLHAQGWTGAAWSASLGELRIVAADDLDVTEVGEMQLFTSGVQRVTIDKAGRVGIGVIPESWDTAWHVLQIGDQTSLVNKSNVGAYLSVNIYQDGTNWRYIESDYAMRLAVVSGDWRWSIAPSGTAGAIATFSESMRIEGATGYVGINNVLTPVEPLEVWTSDAAGVQWALSVRNPYNAASTGYGVGIKLRNDDSVNTKWAGIAGVAETNYSNVTCMAFYTDETELMRLGGSPAVLYLNDTTTTDVGIGMLIDQDTEYDGIMAFQGAIAHGMTTEAETDTYFLARKVDGSDGGASFEGYTGVTIGFSVVGCGVTDDTTKSTAGTGYVHLRACKKSGTGVSTAGADANLVVIQNYTTTRFIFDAEGTGHADVAWVTFSDLRLKTDVAPLRYGLAEVLALNPVQYNRLETGRPCVGLVAQDVYGIIPEVTRSPTTPDSFWSLDTAGIVPVLIRAVQELGQLVCALADASDGRLDDQQAALLDAIRQAREN